MSATTGNDILSGDNSDNFIDLLAGSDSYAGLGGDDSVLGNDGKDTIDGGDGDDTIFGGLGNDLLLAGAGNDRLFGGGGNDSFVAGSTPGSEYNQFFNGGDGDDVFSLNGGNDTVIGGSGYDRVEFNADDDTINLTEVPSENASGIDHIVLAGANQQLWLSAADVLRFTDSGILRVSGADGNVIEATDDEGWVQGASADGFTTFTNGAATVLVADNLLEDDDQGETLQGTEGNDTTSLGDGSDSYAGLGGNDSVLGNDGDDTIDGGNGADTVNGGSGDDSILGGNGDDRIWGGLGNDTIDAGAGFNDRIQYNLQGAEPVTVVISNSGSSSGFNRATVSTATQGTDSIMGFENLTTTTGDDHITVNSAATDAASLFIFANSGNDTIIANTSDRAVHADYRSLSATSGVSVDLAAGVATDQFGTDSLVGIRGVSGSDQADVIHGSSGNDRFRLYQGNDYMDGRGGSDLADYSYLGSSQAISVNLAEERANDGQGGTDTLISIEEVRGGAGNDTIIGDSANNNFRGNFGSDLLDGGAGFDSAEYTFNTSAQAISVNLLEGRANDGLGGTDTLISIEEVRGGAGNDTIIGDGESNVLHGNAGNDHLDGGEGDDTIIGSDGDDLLLGGAGNDLYLLAGAAGEITIDGMSGNDTVSLLGATNEDIPESDLTDIAGIEAIDLAGGGNTLHLTAARIGAIIEPNLLRVFGVADNDSLTFDDTGWIRTGSSDGFDTLENAAGNATVVSTRNLASVDISSVVSGGDGNDTIGTGIGDDTIDGGNGADLIAAFAGDDSVLGGDGHDSIDGGDGADTILGGIGNDRIQGGSGNDSLIGGEGDDTLDGGSGADTLLADSGTDSLAGGADGDLYIAGATGLALRISDSGGNDTLSYAGAAAGDIASASLGSVSGIEAINLGGVGHRLTLDLARVLALSTTTDELRVIGSGSDSLVLSDAGWVRGTPSGGFVTLTNGTAAVIASESLVPAGPTPGNDVLDGSAGNDLIDALGGDDLVRGLGGNDSLIGGEGDDTLDGGDGADSMVGGNGDDVFIVGEGDVVRESSGQGTDTVLLRRASFSLSGIHIENVTGDAAGLEFAITGNTLLNVLTGGSLADTLDGASNRDTLNGGAGNDSLIGGSGNDSLIGGEGDDTLDGGDGADSMVGGNGDDVFIVGEGDVVRESSGQGTDTVLLRRASFSLSGIHIENVTGDAAGLEFAITGNTLLNVLTGGGLADTLDGASNHDTLNGGAGNDSLIGGSGRDFFIFDTALDPTNVDTIQGYSATDDTIVLDDAVFVGIGAPGTSLAATAFITGAAATSTDHRIIYDSTTGALFYDADGSGTGAAVQFATLTGVSGVITNTEFLII